MPSVVQTGVLGDPSFGQERFPLVPVVPDRPITDMLTPAIARGTQLMLPKDVSAPGGLSASIGQPQARIIDEIQVRMPTTYTSWTQRDG
jgi:hypothetical protein